MTLTGSVEDHDPRELAWLQRLLRGPLKDRSTIQATMQSLRLEAARPSEICRQMVAHCAVDLDLLADVLATRLPA